MGNFISSRTDALAGKVILPDGTIQTFDQPLSVAELMLEYPQQFIVEFRTLLAGNRPAPLPADKKLEPERVYLMLPMKQGKANTLSSEETRLFLAKARLILQSGSFSNSLKILPRLGWICPPIPGNRDEIGFSKKDGLVEKKETSSALRSLSESFAQRPEYFSRQCSGKEWKPTLDTIKEKAVERKVSHWLF